jgi:hypothetical protein
MENSNSPRENNKYKYATGIKIDRLVNKETYKNFDELIKCKICFDILVNLMTAKNAEILFAMTVRKIL